MKNLTTNEVMLNLFKSPIASKTTNTNFENESGIRQLNSEEILAVAGGPEVDVEAGGGGG